MRRVCRLAVVLMFVCAAWPAIAASCSVNPTNIQFGSFSGTAIAMAGTMTISCTSGTAYNIGIDAGTGIGATVTSRSMTGPGSAQLGYGLFRDSAHTLNWGNAVGVDTLSGTGTGKSQSVSFYALLPSNEYAPAGTYTDNTVNVYLSGSGFATATAHFSVKATVAKACNISATPLVFGVYSGSLINATCTISVTCTSTTTYDVGLNAGTATGATVSNRSMTGPGGTLLGYKLFRDSGHLLNWGNTVGTDTVAGTGTGIAQPLTVYGQAPALQTGKPPGNYSDTITATITY